MKKRDMPAMPLDVQQAEYLYRHVEEDSWAPYALGLTKREYAAIKIMAGLASSNMAPLTIEEVAQVAAAWADALFNELEKGQ